MGATDTWTEDSLRYAIIGWQNIDLVWTWGFSLITAAGQVLEFKDVTSPLVSIVSTVKTFDNKFLSVGFYNDELNRNGVRCVFLANGNIFYCDDGKRAKIFFRKNGGCQIKLHWNTGTVEP